MAYIGQLGNTSEVSDDELNKKRTGKPLEAGWYRVALEKDEAKVADWGTGLSMEFVVLSGDFEGRKLFDFLCIEHRKSEQAQHIARVRLRELATAAGHQTPDNVEETEDLYGRPVMAQVYRAKDTSDYADEDGKKARIGQFLSVDRWKAECADEPTPGITRGTKMAPPPARSKPASKSAPAPAHYDYGDELPF